MVQAYVLDTNETDRTPLVLLHSSQQESLIVLLHSSEQGHPASE